MTLRDQILNLNIQILNKSIQNAEIEVQNDREKSKELHFELSFWFLPFGS